MQRCLKNVASSFPFLISKYNLFNNFSLFRVFNVSISGIWFIFIWMLFYRSNWRRLTEIKIYIGVGQTSKPILEFDLKLNFLKERKEREKKQGRIRMIKGEKKLGRIKIIEGKKKLGRIMIIKWGKKLGRIMIIE